MKLSNIRRTKTALLLPVLMLLLTACSNQPTYSVDHSETTDFSHFKTYRWYDDTHSSELAEYRQYNSSDKRVREYVERELKQKGFREVDSGTADFWVNYNISKQDHMSVDSFNGYPSAGMHGGVGVGSYGSAVSIGYSSGPTVRTYKEGTVVLDIIDASSNKIVWRGIANGHLKSSLDVKERNHIASEVSRQLLADFPPQ